MAAPTSRVVRHYNRALGLWPKDVLRPECQFQDVMLRGIQKRLQSSSQVDEAAEMKQVNALYSLLEDRYRTRYPLVGRILEPRSQPTYYADLLREVEEVPTRSWFTRFLTRWSGAFRLQ
ncbi:Cytochrome B pre-mRNA-processing protein 6 [Ceratocystis fimbriata CBS 114723]|uniref:Cytochrome B pre-mRNA-processing protein 6 n=1 Tax=Ceratocystis fimbriata CBS 114723 TaxID=1035309 RepID=A0A2C5X1Z3_9PEZI|nr:Cytochrome B pre-mRNA-processing protein 6 [Ceratocystis fimbriata CBS 114723]